MFTKKESLQHFDSNEFLVFSVIIFPASATAFYQSFAILSNEKPIFSNLVSLTFVTHSTKAAEFFFYLLTFTIIQTPYISIKRLCIVIYIKTTILR